MGRQQWVYHLEPEDFPQRLEVFKDAVGLTWQGLARSLKLNARTVCRWKARAQAHPGHLVCLFSLATGLGLLHHLLPAVGEPEGEGDRQE